MQSALVPSGILTPGEKILDPLQGPCYPKTCELQFILTLSP